jgi:chromosome segregation ATPase
MDITTESLSHPSESPSLPGEDQALLARKRRIQQRTKQQRGDEQEKEELCSKRPREALDQDIDSDDETEDGKPSIRGIKKQARYEPGVPMTKEQLTAWRKEARRVRNRESAAQSRQKTRSRIDELEGELSTLQSKYDSALKRIAELEGNTEPKAEEVPSAAEVIKSQDPQVQERQVVSPETSPVHSPSASPLPTPHRDDLFNLTDEKYQHSSMIQWPTAA